MVDRLFGWIVACIDAWILLCSGFVMRLRFGLDGICTRKLLLGVVFVLLPWFVFFVVGCGL